jgi:hypothetical protein
MLARVFVGAVSRHGRYGRERHDKKPRLKARLVFMEQ